MANRFDNGSISAYTPQSMQELAFTPMMKRSQHDEMSKNLAELNAIATDPLNEHRDEALKLKQDLENKLGNLSGELASRGIDGIGKEAFYKLQKERNDLIAPTGRIGEINAAKIAEAKVKDDFFKNADKRIPQSVLENNWQEYRKKYTGYSDPEKTKIENIKSLGSVGYQDLESDIKDKAPLLGETTKTKLRDLGARYEMRPQGMILVTGNGKEITTENSQQLNELGKVLESKYFNDKGEGYAYNKFAGKDQQNQLDILNNSLKMMIDDKTVKDMNTNYQHINYPEGSGDGENPEDPDTYSSPFNTETIGGNEESINFIDQIGITTKNTIPIDPKDTEQNKNFIRKQNSLVGKTFKYTDLPEKEASIYKAKYDELIRNHKINKSFQDPNNKATAAFVKKQLLKDPITLSDRKVNTDIVLNNLGFPSEVDSKKQESRNKSINQDLKNGSRDILDPDTLKPISYKDFISKYGFDADEDKSNIEFDSQLSPMHHKKTYFGNSLANGSPDIIRFKDKNGASRVTYVSKNSGYLKDSNNAKADDLINKIYRNVTLNRNDFKEFKELNSKIKYIPEQDAVVIQHFNGETEDPMSWDEFSKKVYSTKL